MFPFLLSLLLTISLGVVLYQFDRGERDCLKWEIITKRTWSSKVNKFIDVPTPTCMEEKK